MEKWIDKNHFEFEMNWKKELDKGLIGAKPINIGLQITDNSVSKGLINKAIPVLKELDNTFQKIELIIQKERKMKEEDKYYTPEIEEFHIGFEYEILQQGDYIKTTFLTQSEFGFDDVDDLINISRVKYLDREDIESLGFEMIESDKFIKDKNKFTKYLLTVHLDNFQIRTSDSNECLFCGYFKNKSELKRILKQLGI